MRHGVWRAVPHWRKYCLTKQTATHETRLRRACSAVKCLLQNSRRFFSMDLGMGPSVGLVIFYEIFYEKSIFFLRKKQIQKWQGNTLDLHIFLPKFPEFPAGGPNLFFRQTFVAVATITENGRCTGKYGRSRHHVIFFHNICHPPTDDKSPALTYTAHAALRIQERLLRTQPFLS